jgi:hypothetical protein
MAHGNNGSGELPVLRLEGLPAGLRAAAPVLIVLGGALFVAALLANAERAWQSYLFNWIYFTGIAQGAVMLAMVVMMTKGLWSRTTRRIALSFVAPLPILYLLIIPIWVAAPGLFPWVEHVDPPGKAVYLNVPFMVARQAILAGATLVLSLAFAFWALRPDVGLVRDGATGRLRSLYDRFTRNWRGQEVEEALAHRRIAVIGPILVIAYALSWSVLAWDFVMSLEDHWFSTMIGPYVFMAAFLSGVAMTTIATLIYRRHLGLERFIPPNHIHDLGKMTFAFCVFWAYLWFSQYIVIWYGNLEHEQAFFHHRFSLPFRPVMQTAFLCVFVLPFFGLLGVTPKKTPNILGFFCGTVLFGLWVERYMLIYPSFYHRGDSVPLGWIEVGPALLFAGIVLGGVLWFAQRFPLFQLWQPMGELELEGVTVEVTEAQRL